MKTKVKSPKKPKLTPTQIINAFADYLTAKGYNCMRDDIKKTSYGVQTMWEINSDNKTPDLGDFSHCYRDEDSYVVALYKRDFGNTAITDNLFRIDQ